MKRSRPLSLFLSVLILISCFTVSVSASESENLIDSDLRNWEIMYPDTTHIYYVKGSPGAYCLQVDPTQFGESGAGRVAYIYDLTDLVSGGSYTFSFHLLSHDEVLNNLNINFMESVFYSGFEKYNGIMMIGLCSYNSNNDTLEGIEDCYIHIDKTNYLDYFGSNTKISFEVGNVVNPCIAISYFDIRDYYSTTPMYYYFNNVSLIDNELAKEEGFLAKLFEWFQEKFDAIGESFTNLGNKLTELKNSFLDSLSNLGDTIGSFFDEQLEGIKDFFRGFGNLILYFNWEGEYTNPFEREDSPIDKVSEFFDNLIEYVDSIGTSIENVLDSITGGLHIFDEFTSRFPWLKGIAVFCLALIVITRFIGL